MQPDPITQKLILAAQADTLKQQLELQGAQLSRQVLLDVEKRLFLDAMRRTDTSALTDQQLNDILQTNRNLTIAFGKFVGIIKQ